MKRLFEGHVQIAIGIAVILCGGSFSASAQEVKIIRGASSAASMPRLGKLAAAQAKPLSTAQKLQAVQSVVSRRGKKAGSVVNPLVVGPGKFIAGPARLLLWFPTFVEANPVPVATFSEQASDEQVNVSFTPASSGLYLLDFTIGGGGPFTVVGNNVTQSTNAPSGHLLFVVDSAQANTILRVSLAAEGLWWFYSCEISQIK